MDNVVSVLGKYAKTFVALGTFLTLAGTASTDFKVDGEEALNLLIALAAVFGVYLVPNKK